MESIGFYYLIILIALPVLIGVTLIIITINLKKIIDVLNRLPNEILRNPEIHIFFGNREDWKGNNKQAIDYYLNYLYDLKRDKGVHIFGKTNQQSQEILTKAIQELGGEVPIKNV